MSADKQHRRWLYRSLLILCPALWFMQAVAMGCAQSVQTDFSGYAKNLATKGTTLFNRENFFYDLTRLRTKAAVDWRSRVHSELWVDTELLAGNYLETLDYKLSRQVQRPTFIDAEWNLHESNRAVARQSIFRGAITIDPGNAQLTVGRQRLAWGTGFVWNPTDLLNPLNPVAIERDEKQGVDAVLAVVPLNALSRVEAAYAPGRHELKSSGAVRLHTNFAGYDFSAMGGQFQQDVVLGGDFAGYIRGAGFRGEWAYTWRQTGRNYFRAVINADYNFPHDYYLTLELYYNGQGTTDKRRYNYFALLSGQAMSLARDYMAALLSKNLTPLLWLDAYTIINFDDHSSLVGPALTYSLASNLEIFASCYLFNGSSDSELGKVENYYFAALQFYF